MTDNTQNTEQTAEAHENVILDPIAKVGEKYLPGRFAKKGRAALMWSSAAIIIGGAMTYFWMTTPQIFIKAEPHVPYTEIAIKKDTVIPELAVKKQDSVEVIKGFTTEIPGVNGWVVQQVGNGPETQTIVYASEDGKITIVGGMIDGDGNSISMKHFETFADKSAVVKSQSNQKTTQEKTIESNPKPQKSELNLSVIADTIAGQPKVEFGSGKKKVVVVVDPNCPYCHQYFAKLINDKALQKEVTLVFMPVGILGQDSVDKAALFDGLTNAKAQDLMTQIMFGQQVAATASTDAKARSMNRTQQWTSAGLNVVPMTITGMGTSVSKSFPGVIDLKAVL